MVMVLLLLISGFTYAVDSQVTEEQVKFSGRVSKLNPTAKLMRLKVKFENARFLQKRDRVEFWHHSYPNKKCLTYVEAKSAEYLLLKVPRYEECLQSVFMTVGSYLHLYSEDLKQNLSIAKELIDILLNKKLAVESRMQRFKQELNTHPNRVDAISSRYKILKEKLELELKEELAKLERDRLDAYHNYKQSKAKHEDLMYKLEQYKISDENMRLDRWSLDSKLYFKK